MKLFLDDVREAPEGWTLINTGESLISILQSQGGEEIEALSLDHDLGEGKITGYEVLKWLEAQVFLYGYKPPKKILIHSANPVGRKNMEAAIKSIRKYAEISRDLKNKTLK